MSTNVTATTIATHILVFPYPAQGHMLPLLDFAQKLAVRGLEITILVTTKNLPALHPLLSAHPHSIRALVLPFPPHPKLPLGVENIRDIGNSGNASMIASLSKLEGDFIQWFQSHPSPPQAILSDFFLGWTQNWAEKLNIPRIGFFSSGAFLTCVLNHLLLNVDSIRDLEAVEFPDLPRSPSIEREHLPSIFRNFREGDSDWETVWECLLGNSRSWRSVYNSYALDGEYLEHIKKTSGHMRAYCVGPLRLTVGTDGLSGPKPGSESRNDVLNWLDNCPDGSVLYVCFGSQKLLTRSQMEALALALERSGSRFVLATKSADWAPDELEKQARGRGLVVRGWAPQVDILNHRAVGGFLSHCGWNSLLESIVAGVIVFAWPMEADQFLNARLLVEDLGLAIQVCEGAQTVPDADELAMVISGSLGMNIPQKERARVIREKALEAVEAGGSSSRDLDELVKELNQIRASEYS